MKTENESPNMSVCPAISNNGTIFQKYLHSNLQSCATQYHIRRAYECTCLLKASSVCGKSLKQFMNLYKHTYMCSMCIMGCKNWTVFNECEANVYNWNSAVYVYMYVWCSTCNLILLLLLCKPQGKAGTCQFCNKMSV